MTERLYNQDVYTKTFTATVRSCQEASGRDGYEVILDRTAFFPEGGGQYGDIGWLSGNRVTDTQEKDGGSHPLYGRAAGSRKHDRRRDRLEDPVFQKCSSIQQSTFCPGWYINGSDIRM